MSKDLMILPFEGDNYSGSVLRLCGFDCSAYLSELSKKLGELREKAKENNQFVPDRFTSHLCVDDIDKGLQYGVTKDLVYVFAKDLVELEDIHKEYYKEEDDKNIVYTFNKERALATMMYLKTLPKNRKIALCIH